MVKEKLILVNHIKNIVKNISSNSNRTKRQAPNPEARVPKFEKLSPPSGKNLYLELGVILDKVQTGLLVYYPN